MTKKILIINGPNLNLLGNREKSKYGKATLDEVKKNCESHAKSIGVEIRFDQSNIEGEIVTKLQKAKGVFDGIIINAAGYTHTSVAILDALLAVNLPTIEVHITNIYSREAVHFFVALVRGGLLTPTKTGMRIFHTELLPRYLKELRKK